MEKVRYFPWFRTYREKSEYIKGQDLSECINQHGTLSEEEALTRETPLPANLIRTYVTSPYKNTNFSYGCGRYSSLF